MMFRVITDAPGQTCNRFWSYVDSVGWAIAHHKHTYVLYWDKSIKDYDLLRNNPYVSFPLYSKRGIEKLGYERYDFMAHRIFPNNKLASSFCYQTQLAPSLGFIEGWPTRGSLQYIEKYKREIISLFLPNEKIRESVEDLFSRYRSDGYFIVGVHMRKGDYRNFLNGKYYFSTAQYRAFMNQLNQLYREKKVCFYVSTNEKYDVEEFDGLQIVQPTMLNAAYDLYALGLCDRIIGPISTFSRWASFVGDVPLCFLRAGMTFSSDEQFSPIKDYYHFANGKEILSVKGLEDRYRQYIEHTKKK